MRLWISTKVVEVETELGLNHGRQRKKKEESVCVWICAVNMKIMTWKFWNSVEVTAQV